MSVTHVQAFNQTEFTRLGKERLKELQQSLMPEHAEDVIAIEPDSGGYVLSSDRSEACREFRRRFPHKVAYVVRVDGGPSLRLPWVKW